MSWWVPFAVVGAAALGLAIAFGLTAGRPRSGPSAEAIVHHGRRKSRYEQDNDVPWNMAAFVALAGVVGALVLLAVLIEVL